MATAVQEWMVRSMNDMAMKYEDWLRGCVHHDGRKGNVYLPCDRVLAIADWIEAHRDVAPVVRCEDCKRQDNCLKQVVMNSEESKFDVFYKSVGFCSYGERKDDEL